MYRGKGAKQIAAEIEASDLAREMLQRAECKEAEEEELEGEDEEDEEDSSKTVQDHNVTFSNVRNLNIRADNVRNGDGQEVVEMGTYGMETGSTLYDSEVTGNPRTNKPSHSPLSSPSSDGGAGNVGVVAVTGVSRNGSQREEVVKYIGGVGPEVSSLPLSLPSSALQSGISDLRNNESNLQIGREEERKENKDDENDNENDNDEDSIAPVLGINHVCKSSSSLMFVPLSVSPSAASAMSFANYQNDDIRDCGPESGISIGETSIIRNQIESNNETDYDTVDKMRNCIVPLETSTDRVKRKYDDIGSIVTNDRSFNRSDVSVNKNNNNNNNANNAHVTHKIMVDLITAAKIP